VATSADETSPSAENANSAAYSVQRPSKCISATTSADDAQLCRTTLPSIPFNDDSGQLSVVCGPWSVVRSQWSVVRVVSGPWSVIHGPWSFYGSLPLRNSFLPSPSTSACISDVGTLYPPSHRYLHRQLDDISAVTSATFLRFRDTAAANMPRRLRRYRRSNHPIRRPTDRFWIWICVQDFKADTAAVLLYSCERRSSVL